MMDNYYDEETLLLAPGHSTSRSETAFWTRRAAALLLTALALVLAELRQLLLCPAFPFGILK
jgi:hypothetical protein